MMRAPASACTQRSFSIAPSLVAVLLGLLASCGHGARASSVACDLDIYGTLSGEFPSFAAAQAIGLELETDRATVGVELQAQLPTESGMSLSADASVLLLNVTGDVLDEALVLGATLDLRLSMYPDTLLDIALEGEARWGPVSARITSEIRGMQSLSVSEVSTLQGDVSFVGQVDVLDLLLVESAPEQLRFASSTRLDVHEFELLGQQSFEVEYSDVLGGWSDGAEERCTIEGAIGLNASVLPSVEVEARMGLASRGLASRLEGSVEVDCDLAGLQGVRIGSEGEGELSSALGALTLSYQAEWMGWSRDAPDDPSMRLSLEAHLGRAETSMGLSSDGLAGRLEGSVEVDCDLGGIQCVIIHAEGESALSSALGPLSVSYQAEWMGWSRDDSENSSIRLGVIARMDLADGGSRAEAPQTQSGTRCQLSADVLVDPEGMQITIGAELSFGWSLLEREAEDGVNQLQGEPPLERAEEGLDPDRRPSEQR